MSNLTVIAFNTAVSTADMSAKLASFGTVTKVVNNATFEVENEYTQSGKGSVLNLYAFSELGALLRVNLTEIDSSFEGYQGQTQWAYISNFELSPEMLKEVKAYDERYKFIAQKRLANPELFSTSKGSLADQDQSFSAMYWGGDIGGYNTSGINQQSLNQFNLRVGDYLPPNFTITKDGKEAVCVMVFKEVTRNDRTSLQCILIDYEGELVRYAGGQRAVHNSGILLKGLKPVEEQDTKSETMTEAVVSNDDAELATLRDMLKAVRPASMHSIIDRMSRETVEKHLLAVS